MRPEFASVSVRFVLVCRVRRFGVWGLRLPRGLDSGHTGALIESPGLSFGHNSPNTLQFRL